MEKIKYNLQLFADLNTQTTLSGGLSDEMKTYYSDYLIDNAQPELVHDQFGQKHPIPKNGGKTIEFRKFVPLGKALTPIEEGKTPDGQSLTVTKLEATVQQYGNYVTLSDLIQLTAIDNTLVETTKLLGAQAGMTLDTITREVLNGGTNVIFAGSKNARTDLAIADILTVDDIKKAVRFLKNQNAEPISGYWVAIIHPDVAYDLTSDPKWEAVKTYSDPSDLYEGEIGRLYGVRFVETTESKKFVGKGNGGATVYSTLVIADNAYGVTEITGGGLEHIVKQLGSAGTGDPLNQRATAGWKATKVAERLVENYMIRIESGCTFNDTTEN